MQFCAPADLTPRLGVLGVVTTEDSQWRHEIRSSWLQPSLVPTSIVTRFVMRGLNASAILLAEAARQHDVVFVEALETLSKNRGPLTSTLLWLRCAVVAWPHAELIGKAEDDTWIHMHDVERLLRAALGGLASMGADHLYWGTRYETYHWNATSHRPIGFGRSWAVHKHGALATMALKHDVPASQRCTEPPASAFHGPFAYQKGQLYFLDRALARRFVRDPKVAEVGQAALATTDRRLSSVGTHKKEPQYAVWEDVWLGFALSTMRTGRVGMVDMSVTRSSNYKSITDCTVVWHALQHKRPKALRYVHAWKQQHHQRVPEQCELALEGQGLTCANATWSTAKQCPLKLTCEIYTGAWS